MATGAMTRFGLFALHGTWPQTPWTLFVLPSIDGRRIAPFVLGPVGVGRKGLVYMAGSTFLLAVLSPTLSSTASNYKGCPAATRRFAAVIGGGIFSPQSPSDGCCACTLPQGQACAASLSSRGMNR